MGLNRHFGNDRSYIILKSVNIVEWFNKKCVNKHSGKLLYVVVIIKMERLHFNES